MGQVHGMTGSRDIAQALDADPRRDVLVSRTWTERKRHVCQ